jgi:hypothetical protein
MTAISSTSQQSGPAAFMLHLRGPWPDHFRSGLLDASGSGLGIVGIVSAAQELAEKISLGSSYFFFFNA